MEQSFELAKKGEELYFSIFDKSMDCFVEKLFINGSKNQP